MFARVSGAIVLFDTDDPSHMARCVQLQCQATSAADCQGVKRLRGVKQRCLAAALLGFFCIRGQAQTNLNEVHVMSSES